MRRISRPAPPAAIAGLAAVALAFAIPATPAHAERDEYCQGKVEWYMQQAAGAWADGGPWAWQAFNFWMNKGYNAAATGCA